MNYLNHTFINTYLDYYVCSKCNIEILRSKTFPPIIPDRNYGHVVCRLNNTLKLTCEEVIIKQIIE